LAAFPWRRESIPSLAELVVELAGAGVRRVVLAHGGGTPDANLLASLVRAYDVEVLVAGASRPRRHPPPAGRRGEWRDPGETLLSGAIDFPAAVEAAA